MTRVVGGAAADGAHDDSGHDDDDGGDDKNCGGDGGGDQRLEQGCLHCPLPTMQLLPPSRGEGQ